MLWDVLLKGLVMGLAVAAPVGPIGLLCIRRTLTDGRAAGLATGLGAATADATYGLIVAVGFAATGILVQYAGPMAIGGGVLLMWLGIMSVRAFRRAAQVRPTALTVDASRTVTRNVSRTILKSWLTTFVLTLANPLTILTFVGMIAGLGAAANASPTAPYWLVLGVFIGSAMWWLFLVQLALWARSKITTQVTRWFDLASGLVLAVWGGWIALGALL